MYKKIYKAIKNAKTIVIARHIGVDPDAMASQIALRDSIKLTFKDKPVYSIGNGTVRFNYIGKLDKTIPLDDLKDVTLIVVDTPDKKRVDFGDLDINYINSVKIDHHPYIETFCNLELIDDKKSSASEMVYDLISNTGLKMNSQIAEKLFCGIVTDTNRFLYNSTDIEFNIVSNLLKKYNVDTTKCYANIYHRPFSELALLGYMITNMKFTDNGVGYVKVTNEIISKYQIDTVSSGNIINEFNYTDELLVWLTATEDVKNACIRISIRSRGPIINKAAEKYNGGGHKLASGVRLSSFEDLDLLVKDLDNLCLKYIEDDYENK